MNEGSANDKPGRAYTNGASATRGSTLAAATALQAAPTATASEEEGIPKEDAQGASAPREGEPVALGPTPAHVKELADACMRFVTAKYGVSLDGTSETLSLLDQYVRDARKDLQRRAEATDLLERTVGAYLGEVLRTAFLGEWVAEGDAATWRIQMRTVYLTFNPVGMAREAFRLEPAEGFHAHLETDPELRGELDARLRALGEVEEEEFYAPTTRYDIVETAVEAIRSRMVDEGLANVRFDREDYSTGRRSAD